MSVTIPKNVRQMGEPEAARKIYVEDYVVTYLRQYAKEEMPRSRGAVLLGSAEEQEGIPYLFIRSAMELEPDAETGEGVVFTDQMWMQIYEDIEKYFKGQEILGWFLSVPGFPLEVDYEILSTHRTHFPGWDKVLFMEDPTEGEEAFFALQGTSMERQNGYFIFYERNESMQQYMLEKRDGRSVDAKAEYSDRAARSFRMMVQEKRSQSSQRRVMTLLYGVSTFLVMVVLVIGITMINNYEKMEQVEMALNNLTQSLEEQQTGLAGVSGEAPGQQAAGESAVKTGEGQVFPEEAGSEGTENGGDTGDNPAGGDPANEAEDLVEDGGQPEGSEGEQAESSENGQPQEGAGEEPSTEEPPEGEQPQEEAQPDTREIQVQETAASVPQVYIVRKGDTLRSISRKIYGSDKYVEEICQLNHIQDSDIILIGDKILLP